MQASAADAKRVEEDVSGAARTELGGSPRNSDREVSSPLRAALPRAFSLPHFSTSIKPALVSGSRRRRPPRAHKSLPVDASQ